MHGFVLVSRHAREPSSCCQARNSLYAPTLGLGVWMTLPLAVFSLLILLASLELFP